MELRFYDDPVPFLDVAADHLAEDPVLSTVVAGVATRIADEREAGIAWPEGVPCWFAVVLEGDQVVGTAMRTAKFGSYPAFLLPMPDEAARMLAREVIGRGETLTAANGALPAVEVFCAELAAAVGGKTRVGQHTRLFELGELVEPPPVAGRLRPATVDEQELVSSWYDAFMADADEQAGRRARGERARGARSRGHASADRGRPGLRLGGRGGAARARDRGEPAVVRRLPDRAGLHARRSTAAAASPARPSPQVSKLLLASGERACLFTDQANPTSNKIYEAIGYRRVVDMANLLVE